METITAASIPVRYESPRHDMRPSRATRGIYANIVNLHWLAAPGHYLVLAPCDPAQKHGRVRTRYIGPVSNPVAAQMLKVTALAFGIADRAFQED